MWFITRFVVACFARRAEPQSDEPAGISLDAFVFNVVEMAAAAYLAQPPVGAFWPAAWPPIDGPFRIPSA